jgi:thymidylate synthase
MSDRQNIEGILATTQFRALQEIGTALHEENSRFDLLALFDDVLLENSWSRLFTYLFNSNAEHKLEQRFFRIWMQRRTDSNAFLREFLRRLPDANSSQTVAVSEWQTPDGRRLDILIRVINATGRTVSVVGIENKVDSGEQVDQIADYQQALRRSFPGIPKVAVFLTPDGREPTTSDNSPDCPCFALPYSTILSTCETLLTESEGQATVFLSVLKNHISRLVGVNKMEKQIKSLIHKLYKNPNHRQAIKIIAQYAPNISSVFDGLREFWENLSKQNVKLPIRNRTTAVYTYSTKEFKVQFEELDNISSGKGPWINYMLHFPDTNPDVGDRFTLRVMLWDENLEGKSSGVKERFKEAIQSRMLLSGNLGEHRHWGPWVSLWVGGSYQLVDMGSRDIKGLSSLLMDGVRQTYPELKRKLTAFSKSPIRYR